MSVRRLLVALGAMAAVAIALLAVAPPPRELSATLGDAPAVAATLGPEAVVLAATAAGAWCVWAWGALGLVLTAVGAAPGVLGEIATAAVRQVLPAGLRSGAAVLLGVGLGVAGPLPTPAAAPAVLAGADGHPSRPEPVPDWPVAQPDAPADRHRPAAADPAPDWPEPGRREHVVVRGDCLWRIAAEDLAERSGRPPTDREVVAAVAAWWRVNAPVIGPDPDLIVPDQVLVPPGP